MSEQPPILPVPPVPVPPILPYAQVVPLRPRMLDVLAWTSVVLASLSILADLCGVFQPLTYMMVRSMPSGPGAPPSPVAQISLAPALLSALMSLLELGLAIYLLIAGVLLVRDRHSSRGHHLRYACLKIPIAVLAAGASGWMQYELQSGLFASASGGGATTMPGAAVSFAPFPVWIALIQTVFVLMLSLAYPVILLIVLQLPKIKMHFESIRDRREE